MLPEWVWVLVVAPLATWRITNILYQEKIAEFLHRWTGDDPSTFFGYLINCFYCSSVWVGIAVTIAVLVFPLIILPFALSAIAIFIHETLEGYDQWLLLKQKQ
jgi:hypothetical protein